MAEVKDEEEMLKRDKQLYMNETKRLRKNFFTIENEVIELREKAAIVDQLKEEGILENLGLMNIRSRA